MIITMGMLGWWKLCLDETEGGLGFSNDQISDTGITETGVDEVVVVQRLNMTEDYREVMDYLAMTLRTISEPKDTVEEAGDEQLILGEQARDYYIPFKVPSSSSKHSPLPALRPPPSLPFDLLSSWFINGTLPSSTSILSVPEPQIDVIFTWVNGSDPLWSLRRQEAASSHDLGFRKAWAAKKGNNGLEHHYRENGMLRYGLRSVVKAFEKGVEEKGDGKAVVGEVKEMRELGGFGKNAVRRIHVLSGDMKLNGLGVTKEEFFGTTRVMEEVAIDNNTDRRLGQIPGWLDKEAVILNGRDKEAGDNSVGIQWHFHSEVTKLPVRVSDDVPPLARDFVPRWDMKRNLEDSVEKESPTTWKSEEEWNDLVLPTFNSFVIESQIGWLEGVGDISWVVRLLGSNLNHSLINSSTTAFK